MSSVSPLRAPRDDGAVVAVPPLDQAGQLLETNRTRLAADVKLLGRPLSDLQRQARAAAVAEARAYFAQAGEPVPETGADRLIVAGHQPELFHPGVWVKNFALQGLARRHRLTPLNLIVDNDTAKATVLRLPAGIDLGHDDRPHLAAVPFDSYTEESPYEERRVRDEGLFASLPSRAAEQTRHWSWQPLLDVFWRHAVREARRTPLLGERLVGARRAIERTWGCHNLELPVSRLCGTEPFAWFASHIVASLPEFHQTYNDVVHEYRTRHGLRSRNHPVPDLAREGAWLEAPFWAWRAGQERRQRLFVRRGASAWELRAGAEPWPSLLRTDDAASLVAAWRDLETRGCKVRFRALTTTLFSRLLLADAFIHGIGGALYDQLTDELLRRFYRVEPPAFLILSATLLLPAARYATTAEQGRQLAQQERDLWWNPQRHLPPDAGPDVRLLGERKGAWIAQAPAERGQRRERFHALRELTAQLRTHLHVQSDTTTRRRACQRELEANAVLSRRDYAFVLHPEERLRAFCQRFLQ